MLPSIHLVRNFEKLFLNYSEPLSHMPQDYQVDLEIRQSIVFLSLSANGIEQVEQGVEWD